MSKSKNKSESVTEIELVFDEDGVSGVWYHPALAPVLCSLCGKGCTEVKCVNVNPYCG
jgi:hypothetical protein